MVGGSVARASDAKESIIKLTQRSYIGCNGDSLRITEPTKAVNKATILTVS
jgi:hypothetical protein